MYRQKQLTSTIITTARTDPKGKLWKELKLRHTIFWEKQKDIFPSRHHQTSTGGLYSLYSAPIATKLVQSGQNSNSPYISEPPLICSSIRRAGGGGNRLTYFARVAVHTSPDMPFFAPPLPNGTASEEGFPWSSDSAENLVPFPLKGTAFTRHANFFPAELCTMRDQPQHMGPRAQKWKSEVGKCQRCDSRLFHDFTRVHSRYIGHRKHNNLHLGFQEKQYHLLACCQNVHIFEWNFFIFVSKLQHSNLPQSLQERTMCKEFTKFQSKTPVVDDLGFTSLPRADCPMFEANLFPTDSNPAFRAKSYAVSPLSFFCCEFALHLKTQTNAFSPHTVWDSTPPLHATPINCQTWAKAHEATSHHPAPLVCYPFHLYVTPSLTYLPPPPQRGREPLGLSGWNVRCCWAETGT